MTEITAAVKVKHIERVQDIKACHVVHQWGEKNDVRFWRSQLSPRELNFCWNRSLGLYGEPNMISVNFSALLWGGKSVVKHFPSCLFTADFHTSLSFPFPLLIASVSFLFLCFLKEVEVFFLRVRKWHYLQETSIPHIHQCRTLYKMLILLLPLLQPPEETASVYFLFLTLAYPLL